MEIAKEQVTVDIDVKVDDSLRQSVMSQMVLPTETDTINENASGVCSCGNTINENHNFCSNCGKQLKDVPRKAVSESITMDDIQKCIVREKEEVSDDYRETVLESADLSLLESLFTY